MPDKNLSDYSWQSRVVMGHLLRLSGPGGGGQEPWGSYFELQCEFPLTSASSENATRAAHPQALFPWQQGRCCPYWCPGHRYGSHHSTPTPHHVAFRSPACARPKGDPWKSYSTLCESNQKGKPCPQLIINSQTASVSPSVKMRSGTIPSLLTAPSSPPHSELWDKERWRHLLQGTQKGKGSFRCF